MSQVENNILTIFEPTIELDELEVRDIESGNENSDDLTVKEKPTKFTQAFPIIKINQYDIQTDRLEVFKLKNTGFYPTCRIVFSDTDGFFLARHFPKDGDLIQVFIRSQGDETTFKPIRMDFTVVSIVPAGGGPPNSPAKFIVEGRIYVPNLFTETCEAIKDTSWNALSEVAEKLQLGYASNVEETSDEMIWINPNDTTEKFIQDTVANSYLDDESFFIAYIDLYYYLTFINVNVFFSQEGAVDISKNFVKMAGDTMGAKGDDGEIDGVTPNFLTNAPDRQGDSRYITKYHMVNESGSVSKNNGYKRYSQHWDAIEKKFISEFVDPLTGDTPGFIAATKGRVIDGEAEGPRDEQVRYKYLGTQTENVHEEYMYSVILNYQNIVEVTKLGMVVEIDTINPALLRYTRIFCYMVETGQDVKDVLNSPSNSEESLEENQQQRDIPEGVEDESKNKEKATVNEFLTGFYVISGLEYILTAPGAIRMKLYLQRREFKPTT